MPVKAVGNEEPNKMRPYVTFPNKIRGLYTYVRYGNNNVRVRYVYGKMQSQPWKS